MSHDPPLDPRRLPLPLAAEVDRVCDRFAAEWAVARLPVAGPAQPGGPVGGEGSAGPPDPPAHEGASPSQVRRIRSSLRTTERRPRPIRPAISSLL